MERCLYLALVILYTDEERQREKEIENEERKAARDAKRLNKQ